MIKKIESDSLMAPVKYLLLKAFSLVYFYIICLVVCIAAAFLYNKYSTKVYEASASLSPVENKTSSLLSSNQLFSGLDAMKSLTNIEDEMNSLNSFTLVYKTIANMNFEVSYYKEKENFLKQTEELYRQSPIIITIDKSHVQPLDVKFYFTIIDESSFRLTVSQKKVSYYNYLDNVVTSQNNTLVVDTICKFNETINNKTFRFSASLNSDVPIKKANSEYRYYFTFRNLDYIAKEYLNSLKVEKVSPLASVLQIKFQGQNADKTIAFLNTFLDTFLDNNLEKKNKMARSTVKFINTQISTISDSLTQSESALKNYKSDNQVTDLSFQGQRIYEQIQQIEAERVTLQVRERYYNYVINLFKANKDIKGVVPPSAMNVDDPITNQLISELLNLNTQRSNITSGNSNEKNIFLGNIDKKISSQIQYIIENFTNNLNTLTLNLNELDYREDKLSKEISKLPKTEMNMVSKQRKFNNNDVIYSYLLQKRSEAAIALASNYPDYEILEPAREITTYIVSPKKTFNYLLGFFFGLFIPTLYLFIKEIFDFKIRSINDVEYMMNRPVLNIIYSNKTKSDLVVSEFPKSTVSESFRNLRSSLFLKSEQGKSKVIIISSSQPMDGKSFVSLNLASSIASVGYKTILIDSDLRKPNLHSKLKLDNVVGLSTYMTKDSTTSEIIRKTSVENLSFISAGPIIPNPSELIESGVLDELINYLKSNYDYVIIDTTPIGILSDATLLMKYASKILIVIRNNYTHKDIFIEVLKNLKSNKFNNYDIIYNDLNLQRSTYKRYSDYYLKE
jgi:tyrosine-protein kinase Etk/Wzc